MRKKTYNEEQLNIVKLYYPSGDWEHILPAFPNKTKADIRAIARKNGIRIKKDLIRDMDINGKRFSQLVAIAKVEDGRVVRWRCKCDCGNETIVPIYSLIKNEVKSCGCRRNRPATNAKDFTGKTFGLLTAVERLANYRGKRTFYRCICECGTEKIVAASNLSSGHTRSCGGKVHTKAEFDILNYELDDNEKTYTVYRHISPNGKSYIGITKQNPERRFQQGCGYKTQKAFYRAIKKYGWDAFQHEILESGLTEKEAHEKEAYYIEEVYNSIAPNGYNIQEGGVHARHYIVPIIQYYNGIPVNYFEGITQAFKNLKIAPETIRKYSGKENAIDGYYFEELPLMMPYNVDVELLELEDKSHYRVKQIIEKNARREVLKRNKETAKPINKYTLDGEYICTFPSLTEAMMSIEGHDGGAIAAVVNPNRAGETAYGFMWKYDTGNHDNIGPVKYKMQKAVVMIDKSTGAVVEEFKSMSKASSALGISLGEVRRACAGKDIFNDYYLRYK